MIGNWHRWYLIGGRFLFTSGLSFPPPLSLSPFPLFPPLSTPASFFPISNPAGITLAPILPALPFQPRGQSGWKARPNRGLERVKRVVCYTSWAVSWERTRKEGDLKQIWLDLWSFEACGVAGACSVALNRAVWGDLEGFDNHFWGGWLAEEARRGLEDTNCFWKLAYLHTTNPSIPGQAGIRIRQLEIQSEGVFLARICSWEGPGKSRALFFLQPRVLEGDCRVQSSSTRGIVLIGSREREWVSLEKEEPHLVCGYRGLKRRALWIKSAGGWLDRAGVIRVW